MRIRARRKRVGRVRARSAEEKGNRRRRETQGKGRQATYDIQLLQPQQSNGIIHGETEGVGGEEIGGAGEGGGGGGVFGGL